jgi:YD repeat-containing protein
VLTTTERWQENGAAQTATTRYTYDERGQLSVIETPDPQDDGQTIEFTYTYDALGRLTAFNRPDNTGLTISYDGLNKTVCEQTADGSGGCKRELYDARGRLLALHEL